MFLKTKEHRQRAFSQLIQSLPLSFKSSLVAAVKLPEMEFELLKFAVQDYLLASFNYKRQSPFKQSPFVATDLISFINDETSWPVNVSTSGMVVPKSHVIKEFTQVCRCFAALMKQLGFTDFVKTWNFPLNVRIKKQGDRGSHYPTEIPHSETWVGNSPRSILMYIPLFGDIKKNKVKFYEPMTEIDPNWLKTQSNYNLYEEIKDFYQELPFETQTNELFLSDPASLHQTSIEDDALARVSIDAGILSPYLPTVNNNPTDSELAPHQVISTADLLEIGRSIELTTPIGPEEIFQQKSGLRHPAYIRLG